MKVELTNDFHGTKCVIVTKTGILSAGQILRASRILCPEKKNTCWCGLDSANARPRQVERNSEGKFAVIRSVWEQIADAKNAKIKEFDCSLKETELFLGALPRMKGERIVAVRNRNNSWSAALLWMSSDDFVGVLSEEGKWVPSSDFVLPYDPAVRETQAAQH